MQQKMLTAIATLTLSCACSAQTMYRCGNSFSQTPCAPDAKEIALPKSDPGECSGATTSCIVQLQEKWKKEDALRKKASDMAVVDNPPSAQVLSANTAACVARIMGMLKDPDSAKVRDSWRVGKKMVYQNGKTFPIVEYAAFVNAKNSYGGYTGESLWLCEFESSESAILSVHNTK